MKPKNVMQREDEVHFLRKEVAYLELVDKYNILNKKVFDENVLIVRAVSNCIETVAKEFGFKLDDIKKCYELMNIPAPNIERDLPVEEVLEPEVEVLEDDSAPDNVVQFNDAEKIG